MTPSPNRARATRLFVGGLVGWNAALVIAAVVGALLAGATGLLSALVGAALALAYYAIGQGVQMQYADAPPRTIRAASITSYVVRVSLLGLLLWASISWPGIVAALDARGLFAGIVSGVLGWLVGLVVAFRRLRVPTFDEGASSQDDRSREGC